MTVLLPFAAVSLLASLIPGPDTAVVTKSVITRGRGAAILTAAGCSSGQLLWGAASLIGIGTLLATSVVAFTVVKLIGATYLVAIGLLAIIASRREGGAALPGADAKSGRRRRGSSYREGLLTNALNPKTALFMSALLPQFIKPDASSWVAPAMVITTGVVSFSWMVVYATLLDRIGHVLQRARVRRAIERITGSILIGLGLRIAVEHR